MASRIALEMWVGLHIDTFSKYPVLIFTVFLLLNLKFPKKNPEKVGLEHPDKSAVAEHCVDSEHSIPFHDTSSLATKIRYMDRTVREAIENELRTNNINRDVGFCLSKSWKPLISSAKKSP
jgi:hypothetical protein